MGSVQVRLSQLALCPVALMPSPGIFLMVGAQLFRLKVSSFQSSGSEALVLVQLLASRLTHQNVSVLGDN